MCGIAGRVDFLHDLSGEHGQIREMTTPLEHRGPDADGTYVSRRALLGHRRLIVIDPAGGTQPMVAEEDGVPVAVITYCGEVYNFPQLRTQLQSYGHRFRTRSDTEVVLRAYLQWGTRDVADFASRLTGMFALGIWDIQREELILVRDPMAIKPLYYAPTPHGVLFGSEHKAILANPMAPRRVRADGMCEILDMVKTPGHAVLAGVHEVVGGQIVQVTARGLRTRTYWQLQAGEQPSSLPAVIGEVRDLVEDIVSGQLVADVPLCAFLSGGLDSSCVTAEAARLLRNAGRGAVRTFSVDFPRPESGFQSDAVRGESDARYARDLAAHVGAEHTEIILDSEDLASPATRAAVLHATDLPPAYWGDMWPSLYLLSREVRRRRCTVALSGEGADELFGGYRWFRNPKALTADTFPWLTPGSARYFGGLALLDRGLLDKLDIPGYRADRYSDAIAGVPVFPGDSDTDQRMRRITYLALTRFVQTLLDRKDRMSMAVGLEVRVPFCDHRLVQRVFATPWWMKSFDGREKSLLRAAVADLLPEPIVHRVKNPYPATQDPRYERVLRGRLAGVLADGSSPVLPLLDLDRARRAASREVGQVSWPYDRGSVEMALWLNQWLSSYPVTLDFLRPSAGALVSP